MVSKLLLRDQFEEVLQNYVPNHEVTELLSDMQLVLLMGISASGRDSLIRELVKTGNYFDVVTDTTRQPRINNGREEQNGVDYFFKQEQEMLDGLKAGECIAPAIIHNQQVSAISARELRHASKQHKIAIADVQIEGIEAILQVKPDVKCIFVLPPSFEEWMRRLESRSVMTESERTRRLQSAQYELEHIDKEHYSVIVNDSLAEAAREVQIIVDATGSQKNIDSHAYSEGIRQLRDGIALELAKT